MSIPIINCPVCSGQGRVMRVQMYPGRSEVPGHPPFWMDPISDGRSHRLFWRNCYECYGDGYEDDPNAIAHKLAKMKEALLEKHGHKLGRVGV